MSKILAREVDNNIFTIDHGTYDYNFIQPQNGVNFINTITNGGNQTIFEIPPGVVNFSKSLFNYTVTPTAVANSLVQLFNDTPAEIQQLYVYTQTNDQLVFLQMANTYVKSVLRHETSQKEMLDNEIATDNVIVNTIGPVATVPINGGYWQGLCQMNTLFEPAVANVVSLGQAFYSNPAVPELGTTACVANILTPAYVIPSSAGAVATANPVINRSFPGSIFKGTLLAYDKDIYFPETCYIKIIWEGATRVGYGVTALNTQATPVTLVSYSVSNLSIYCAIEKNPVIEADLRNKFNAGTLKYIIPYVYSDLITINGGTNQSIQTRYNRGHGSKILKIYWSPYTQTTTIQNSFNHSNATAVISTVNAVGSATIGSLVSKFYTTINNVRTNQFDYNCTTADDYTIKRMKLKGSCILNSNDYYTNFTWIEDFCNNYSFLDKPLFPPEENYIDGLDLTGEKIYTVRATTTNSTINHYVFAVCQREMSIMSGRIDIK